MGPFQDSEASARPAASRGGPGRTIDTEQDRIGIYSGRRGVISGSLDRSWRGRGARLERDVRLPELAGRRVDQQRERDRGVLADELDRRRGAAVAGPAGARRARARPDGGHPQAAGDQGGVGRRRRPGAPPATARRRCSATRPRRRWRGRGPSPWPAGRRGRATGRGAAARG